jgi:hypothetical protein
MAGNMLDIYPNIPKHRTQQSAFLNLRWGKTNPYRELYGNPEHGIILSFHELGNRRVFGQAVGLQYQVSFNQYLSRRWRTFQRINYGGLWVNRPYHFIDNPENIVFGSPFSSMITVSAGVRYKVHQHAVALQASYWHSSNAHTVLPNVGMNTPMLMLSFERFFYIEDIYIIDTNHRRFQLAPQFGLQLYGALGLNEAGGTIRPTNGAKYNKYLLSLGGSYRYKTIHRVSLTLDAYYDEAYALWNETMQWSSDRPVLGASAVMLLLGHEFIYDRFGLVIQGGVNVYNPTLGQLIGKVESPSTSNRIKRYVPGRFALRYYVNKDEHNDGSLFIQIAVKSNMGQADFMEIGIGSIISRRQVQR